MRARRAETRETGAEDDPAAADPLMFLRLVWAMDHALHRASKRMHAATGVTGPQRLVVRILGRFPDLSAAELAALLHLDPSTMTGVLARMEGSGLIRRRRDPADRRRWKLSLTARGRVVDARTTGTVESAVRSMMREARPGDLEATRRVLTAMVERLGGS